MSEILQFLQQRNSAPRLTKPAPDESQLREIIRAAIRAPDHAWLRPWRFISIDHDRRDAFGEVLRTSLQQRNPDADQATCDRASKSPLRAPLILVAVAHLREHPKVPAIEQRLSAGCAAQGVLLAAEALGFAGLWRTGDAAFDRTVMDALGLLENEEIVGFLYLGTRVGERKQLPVLDIDNYISRW